MLVLAGRGHGLLDRDVDVLTFARSITTNEGKQSATGGDDIALHDTDRAEGAARLAWVGRHAAYVHQVAHCGADDVLRQIVAIRPPLAKRRHGSVNQAWVRPVQVIVAQAALSEIAGLITFDEDIGVTGEF